MAVWFSLSYRSSRQMCRDVINELLGINYRMMLPVRVPPVWQMKALYYCLKKVANNVVYRKTPYFRLSIPLLQFNKFKWWTLYIYLCVPEFWKFQNKRTATFSIFHSLWNASLSLNMHFHWSIVKQYVKYELQCVLIPYV